MRLIDADKLVVDARLGENEIPYVSKAQIDEAPTVEAIPIEWIKRWAMKSENTYNREQIIEMLNDWEKENETKTN